MNSKNPSLIRMVCRATGCDRIGGYRRIEHALQSWRQRSGLAVFGWALRDHAAKWHELAVDIGSCTDAGAAEERCRWWRRRLPRPLMGPLTAWLLRIRPERASQLFRAYSERTSGSR